ncbi:hypothetical protein ACFPRA_21250 [Sporosarcina soli]|uniref:Uncharacterized protein n=1 Tax=Sporosarcina soli TaxID=334736 RepID=A0ABW0TQ10_9BACL
MKRKTMFQLGGGVILVIILSWVFPYAFFSVDKSVTYKPDAIFVEQYQQDLQSFKTNEEIGSTDHLIFNRTAYIMDMFEQDWLLNENGTSMRKADLEEILVQVKNKREHLIELAFHETYSTETKEYLKDTLRHCLALEESIVELKNAKYSSRASLKRRYHNLHMSFVDTFDRYKYFYNEFKETI